jgi:hypothetical protein
MSRVGEETEVDGIKSFLRTWYFIKLDSVIILISQWRYTLILLLSRCELTLRNSSPWSKSDQPFSHHGLKIKLEYLTLQNVLV